MSLYNSIVSVLKGMLILAVILIVVVPVNVRALEFEASTAPDGQYLLKVYPNFYFTSAYFNDDGKAMNLPDVTGLLYFELPVYVQYGVTGSFSVGAILPIGWTYQETEEREDPNSRLAVRELWLTLQHRWITKPFVSSSSIRIKLPLADKEEWEDGLRIGDGQVDILPAYHFEYLSPSHYWFINMSIGYKYRFKTSEYKPLDELKFYVRGGYELFADLKMRFFLYADMTRFMNGEYHGDDLQFFEHDGCLHSYGYGISLWPRPTFRVEFVTGGDWSGRNQYRGIRWLIGVTKVI
jgi:hypothetical protein